MAIRLRINDDAVRLSLRDDGIKIKLSDATAVRPDIPPYEGPYEVTPSRETQTLHTGGYRMDGDVTVYPIPRNYGLITYNGFEITVS